MTFDNHMKRILMHWISRTRALDIARIPGPAGDGKEVHPRRGAPEAGVIDTL